MDKYGDDIAGPRLAKVLRRYQHVSTGSRLGFVGHTDHDRSGLFARNKGMAPGTGPLASAGIPVTADDYDEIGRAAGRVRGVKYVYISGGEATLKKKIK